MPPRVATARLQPRRPPASANLPNKAVPCLLASNPSQKLESRSSLKGNPLSDSVSSDSALARLEFGIPVEEVAPAVVQEIGRGAAAVLLQQMSRRLHRRVTGIHAAFPGYAIALEQIAARAGRDDVLPGGAPAARARHDVIERQIVGREVVAAILADEAVAQEHVESREGRTPRRRNVFLERDDAGQPHLEGGAAHDAVVKRDDVDPVEAYRLDRLLPRPQRQGEVAQRTEIRVEHQRRTVIEP